MMRFVAIDGPEPRHVHPKREDEIYALLLRRPELLEKNTLFKVLSINVRTEKGPDFIAVNHKGHLIIGEIKRGGMPAGGWAQAKRYAKLLGRMREAELEHYIADRTAGKDTPSLRHATKGFLGPTARAAFFRPSRRRVQLLLVAEHFSDSLLRSATRAKLGARLRELVRDVKCVEIRTYRVRSRSTFGIASVVSGRSRRLRK
jgi:hypothetical protein